MEGQGHQQHHQAAELRSAGVEEGVHELGEEHEKKSMLKKVKAKAKKIKDTITKHGHGHGHDHHHDDIHGHGHGHGHHDHVDDDEMEQGTEVHGAQSLYESKEVRSYLPAQVGGGRQTTTPVAEPLAAGHSRTDANPEAKTESREVPSYVPGQPAASIQSDVVLGGGPEITAATAAPFAVGHHRKDISDANPSTSRQGHELSDYRSFVPEQVGVSKHNGVTFRGSQTYPVGVGGRPSSQSHGYKHETNLPLSSGMGIHQQQRTEAQCAGTDVSNANSSMNTQKGHELSGYRSGQTHPVGTQTGVVGGRPIGPASQSLAYTGAHEATKLPLSSGMGLEKQEVYKEMTGIFDRPTSLELDPHGPRGDGQPENYQSMVKDPTGRGGQEIGVTPILHSLDKMAIFYDKNEHHNAKTSTGQQERLYRPNVGHAEKDHHSLSSGTHGQSYYSGTSSHDQFAPEPLSYDTSPFAMNPEQDTGFASGSPTEQDIGITRAGLSVSSATSLIADKAIQAKNVVASKLGYGGEGEHPKTTVPSYDGEDQAGKASSVTDYGKKVVSTVYNKVAGVGDALMPKMQGSPTTEHGTEGPIYNKGVSTKDYIAGKVSPRNEDKALSDVIVEKVSPRKEDKAVSDVIVEKMSRREEDKELSEVTSGALHKEADHEGEDEKKAEPSGKVTFSAKVARQLGTNEERSEDIGSGKTGPRGAVAETLRDTVTSWLGIGGDTGPSYVIYHDLPKEENVGVSGHNHQQQEKGYGGEPKLK